MSGWKSEGDKGMQSWDPRKCVVRKAWHRRRCASRTAWHGKAGLVDQR